MNNSKEKIIRNYETRITEVENVENKEVEKAKSYKSHRGFPKKL